MVDGDGGWDWWMVGEEDVASGLGGRCRALLLVSRRYCCSIYSRDSVEMENSFMGLRMVL